MKKVLYVLVMLVLASQMPAEAQFLKGLKEKAEKELKKQLPVKKDSRQSSGDRNSSNASGNNAGKADDDETPQFLRNIHRGTMHYDTYSGDMMLKKPQRTSSTRSVTFNDRVLFSDFHEGLAYVYSYEDGACFIDKAGNKVFSTAMSESSRSRMPRFGGGVFMEIAQTGYSTPELSIRDNKGNTVKKLEKALSASNFVDGVAMVAFKGKEYNLLNYMTDYKYVDSKGNLVFPDLWFTTALPAEHFSVMNGMMRKKSEGLIAFCKEGLLNGKKVMLWGFRDDAGKIVIKPEYLAAGDFSEGLAAVSVAGSGGVGAKDRWGFIDKSGNMVIQPKFSVRPTDFNSGYSLVSTTDNKSYYMDKTGAMKLGPVSVQVSNDSPDGTFAQITPFYNGYAVVSFVARSPYGYGERFGGVIDTNFNIISWGKIDSNHISAYGIEGKHYMTYDSGSTFNLIDPLTFDCKSIPLREVFVEGVSALDHGFIDENNNYVIVFEEDKF